MQATLPPQLDAPVEVEEADLSSEDDVRNSNPSHPRSSPQEDFVLDDEDDDDSMVDQPHLTPRDPSPPHRTSTHIPSSHHAHSPQLPSASSNPHSPSKPNSYSNSPLPEDNLSDDESPSSQHDNDSSSYKQDADSEEEDDEDELEPDLSDNDFHPSENEKENLEHANGDAHQSDSDDGSDMVRRKRTKPSGKLVIPESMIDDGQYFRRSSRQRSVPERFQNTSPRESASSIEGSDFDFNAEEGKLSITFPIHSNIFYIFPHIDAYSTNTFLSTLLELI